MKDSDRLTDIRNRRLSAALVALLVLSGCSRAPEPETGAPAPQVGPEHLPPSEPDVRFMSDMIHHHAQAIRISRWAPTHGASAALGRLAERIVVGQQDEIDIMQRWLRTHGKPGVEVDTAGTMAMDHSRHMPGMLSEAELAQLDRARGADFDRLYLTLMIRHHQGALTMVDELFGSQGAAQNDVVFRIASDVYAEQTTEIGRMLSMLDARPGGVSSQ
jgi:uncharacterized protein (DUF305 family)